MTLEDGNPILAKAAEEAVRKWRYDVTLFHDPVYDRDRPAEVDTAIGVEFNLPKWKPALGEATNLLAFAVCRWSQLFQRT